MRVLLREKRRREEKRGEGLCVSSAFAVGLLGQKKMKKYLDKKQPEQKAQSPCLAIHDSARSSQESIEHIQVGSFYEIDHSKLPPKTPEQLQSIRVVMVSRKSLSNVSVRFPSPHSLHTHLNENSYENLDRCFLPALEELYVMGPAIASEVLYRRIPHQEIEEQSKTGSFWEVGRRFANPKSPSSPWLSGGVMSPSDHHHVACLSSSSVGWANGLSANRFGSTPRMRVRQALVQMKRKKQRQEEDDKAQEEAPCGSRKRKKPQKKPKTANRPNQNHQIVVHNPRKKKLPSICRWSESRYKAAEENIVTVMKAKGASAENPIQGAQLKSEVRKLTGDTGLIDHLFKHMEGEVTPRGAHRFRRRRNADCVFEYWIESADLVSIRKEAGIEDPYWTPPPGWKIGDDPTQDPTCARMFKEIWEHVANVTREMKFKHQEDSARIEEQMVQFSHSFSGINEEIKSIQEEMRVLKPTMEDSALVFSESAEVPLLVSDAGREMGTRDKASMVNKAASIERLRSSFRICKQQGTFLWPNMSMSPKGVVQQTNSSLVPTPPSVYSSNKLATRLVINTPNGHNPGSPLKPLAERRAVSISTLSNIVTPQSQIDSISVGKTRDINFNEFPDPYKNRDTNAISGTLTYYKATKYGEGQNGNGA